MRVLHIIPGFGGGISSFVGNLARAEDSGCVHDVAGFSAYPEHFRSVIEKQGGRCVTLPRVHRHPLAMARQFRRLIREGRYDVLHCHLSGYKGLVFKLLAGRRRCRVITHAHRASDETQGAFHGLSVALSRRMSRALSTDMLSCSDMAGRFIFGDKAVDGGRVARIPNAVDVQRFLQPADAQVSVTLRSELEIPDGALIIGHVGRFNLQKNHRFLLEICDALAQRGVPFVCLMVGDGELRGTIEAEAQQRGLAQYVRFTGKRSDVPDLFRLMDVFVLPSLFEGLPTVAVEAQAAGVRCLLSSAITPEADMGMGLTQYLRIDDAACWAEAVCQNGVKNLLPEQRLACLTERGFTLEAMQAAYRAVLMKGEGAR